MAEVEARCRYRPSRAWFALARRLLDGSLDPSCPVRLSSLAMTISRGPTSTPGCTIRAAGWCRKLRGLWRRPRRPNDGRVLRGLLASSCLEALFRPSGGAPSRRVGRGRACTPHAYAGTGLQFATGPPFLHAHSRTPRCSSEMQEGQRAVPATLAPNFAGYALNRPRPDFTPTIRMSKPWQRTRMGRSLVHPRSGGLRFEKGTRRKKFGGEDGCFIQLIPPPPRPL